MKFKDTINLPEIEEFKHYRKFLAFENAKLMSTISKNLQDVYKEKDEDIDKQEFVLKSKEDIEAMCHTTEEGQLGYEYIEYNYDMLQANNFYSGTVTALKVEEYKEGYYAFFVENARGGVGNRVYVHLDWLAKIDGYKTTAVKALGGVLTKITSKTAIDIKTGELTKLTDIPMCDCGNLGTTLIDGGTSICQSCVDNAVERKSYSYKPEYKFIGKQLAADRATPTWYGMEVEISTNKDKLAKFALKNRKGVYLKSDSSINGSDYAVEIVTMPHSFSELMLRNGILDNIGDLPTNDSDNNGTHIHISRTAFVDDKHYSLFYFLIHKMDKVATKVDRNRVV